MNQPVSAPFAPPASTLHLRQPLVADHAISPLPMLVLQTDVNQARAFSSFQRQAGDDLYGKETVDVQHPRLEHVRG